MTHYEELCRLAADVSNSAPDPSISRPEGPSVYTPLLHLEICLKKPISQLSIAKDQDRTNLINSIQEWRISLLRASRSEQEIAEALAQIGFKATSLAAAWLVDSISTKLTSIATTVL